MVEERRTDLRGPTSTLEIENMISLYFQLCYEDIFCLSGNNDGGEHNLHATFHDKSEHYIVKVESMISVVVHNNPCWCWLIPDNKNYILCFFY